MEPCPILYLTFCAGHCHFWAGSGVQSPCDILDADKLVEESYVAYCA